MGKRQNKEKIENTLKENGINIYLTFMLLLFPLYHRNGYGDILRAKRSLYLNITGIFLLCMFFLCFLKLSRQSLKNFKKGIEKKEIIFNGLVVIEILILGISTFFAQNRTDAFLGLSGRYLGSLVMIMGYLTVILIGKYLSWNFLLNWMFIIGSGSVYLLQIINSCGWDILRMQVEGAEWMQMDFLSTIGNINFNATFNCMMLPVGMVFYMICKEKFSKRIYGSYLFAGFAGSICCRSDSVYFGIGTGFFVLLYMGLAKKEYLQKWIEEIILFWSASVMMFFMKRVWGIGYELIDLGQIVTDIKVLGFGAVSIVLLWYFVKKKEPEGEMLAKLQKRYVYLGIISALLFLGVLLLINKAKIVPVDVLPFSYFYLTDAWGSGRVYIWKRCLKIFKNLTLREKLFGCGMNSPQYLLNIYYGEEMLDLYSAKFIDAHNEGLQFLLSIGILGTTIYYLVIVLIFRKSIKLYRKGIENAIFAVCVIPAFLAQGLVNNPQIAGTPILFVGLGIFWNIIKNCGEMSS